MKIKLAVIKIVPLFLIGSVVVYLFTRIFPKLMYVESYFNNTWNTWNIVFNGKKVSYDEKMFDLMGSNYLVYKNIKDATLESAVICIQNETPDLDVATAAYFLYPRTIKRIKISDNSVLTDIQMNKCTNIILYKNYPEYDIKITQAILFSDRLVDENSIIKTGKYIHNSIIYTNKVGILQL